jgi:hypothetical protein
VTTHATTRRKAPRRRAADRLAHALVLAEARRLADGGTTPEGNVRAASVTGTEERATPLAALALAVLADHGVTTDDAATRRAVGTLAVTAADHVDPGHTQRIGDAWWLAGTTPLAAIARALHEADVDLDTIGVEHALRSLGDAIAARALAEAPAAEAAPAATAPGPASTGPTAADLLDARAGVERTKSVILNSTSIGIAASLVAAVLYGAGLLGGRPLPVISAGLAAVALAVAAVVVLVAALFPRTGPASKRRSADDLAAEAERLAADDTARRQHAAAELAVLQKVNAAKSGLIRVAVLLLSAGLAAAAAAVLIETL